MREKYIYLDNNATTPLDPRALDVMMPYLQDLYGNAASSHRMGKEVKRAIDTARRQVADLIDVNPEEIHFTAGATEAINIALQGISSSDRKPKHIITVQTEHPAVLDTCRYLETIGVEVTYLSVNAFGLIDFEELNRSFKDNTLLVCVMLVNNETGVIQDIKRIANLAHEHGALFMTDGTQAVGKVPFEASEYIDILAFSAHKFYGPKGIGGLYVNPHIKLRSLIYGGGHERGLRSGTLNVPGIVGIGKAAEIARYDMLEDANRVGILRDKLEAELLEIEGTVVNGSKGSRIYNTTNISFEGIDNEALLLGLKNVCVSNGSACHSFTMEPSYVLTAMGLTHKQANESLRFSIGRFNTEGDILTAVEAIKEVVDRMRTMVS